ncbi:RcnB family protein, partial [Burkholderia glumae]
MKTSRLLLALLLAGSLGSPLAFAQQPPPGGDHGPGPGGPEGPGGPAHHHPPRLGHGGPAGHPPGGPRAEPPGGFIEGHRDWRRGDRLPREYWDRQYVIDDWRDYHLAPPPRGYHWVGVGGDYLLVQIGNGLVLRVG